MALGFWETLITAQGDGTAVTAAAATTLLPAQAKKTLLPNYFDVIGKQMLIKATGRISNVTPTPGTARFDLRFGATVVWDGQAIVLDPNTAYTNVGWIFELLLTCRGPIGAANTLFGQGTYTAVNITGEPATPPKAAMVAVLPWNQAPVVGTAFDSTVAQVIDFFFTQTVTSGSCLLHQFAVYGQN